MYLYFAAKIRKSIHIMAYQCIKNKKSFYFPFCTNVWTRANDEFLHESIGRSDSDIVALGLFSSEYLKKLQKM